MDDKKFTPREIEILLHKVNIISTTPELEKRFRTKYATDFDLVNATIRESFIKDSAVHFIHQIVPTMFKIGNNVFLLGDTRFESCDFIGDDLGKGDIIELQDMTTEMGVGESYSFFVSETTYFPVASISETVKVINFLKLNK